MFKTKVEIVPTDQDSIHTAILQNGFRVSGLFGLDLNLIHTAILQNGFHVSGLFRLDLRPIYTAIPQNGFHVSTGSGPDLQWYSPKWLSRARIVPTRSETDLHCSVFTTRRFRDAKILKIDQFPETFTGSKVAP